MDDGWVDECIEEQNYNSNMKNTNNLIHVITVSSVLFSGWMRQGGANTLCSFIDYSR